MKIEKRPKIYFLKSHIDSSTGASKAIIDIMNALAEIGWEVGLIITKRSLEPFHKLSENVSIERLPLRVNPVFKYVFRMHKFIVVSRIRKKLIDSDIKIIVAFNYTYETIRASKRLNTKVIVSERSNFDNLIENESTFLKRKRWFPLAAAITSNSKTTTEEVRKLLKSDKVYFTPNPYRVPLEEGQIDFANRPKIILIVARFTYNKGYDILFKALQMIKNELGDWMVNIVGDGPLEIEIKNMGIELGIDDKLNYIGTTNNVSHYFLNAGMYILPSRFEGVSNAMLDAMKFGLPIIISSVAGSLEYIEDEKNGLVFPIGDSNVLAQKILRILKNDKLRENLGRASYKTAVETAKKNNIKPWEDVILKVLNYKENVENT